MGPEACSSHVESVTNSAEGANDLPTAGLWKACGLWKVRRRVRLAERGGQPPHLRHVLRVGGLVEIGEPERTYTVEPVEDPVPRERPAEPAEPAGPPPAKEPVEPEKAPAR